LVIATIIFEEIYLR